MLCDKNCDFGVSFCRPEKGVWYSEPSLVCYNKWIRTFRIHIKMITKLNNFIPFKREAISLQVHVDLCTYWGTADGLNWIINKTFI